MVTARAVLFLFNVIETTFLRSSSTSEFSHSLGQNRKSSMRAYVFRCSPNNGHRQDTSVCPFRAMDGQCCASLDSFAGPHVLWIGWGNLRRYERLHSVHDTFRVQSVY